VDQAVRRAVAIVVLGVLCALAPAAFAQDFTTTPSARFTSPTRAVAGAPIFVRSITPCPAPAAPVTYAWVNVYIHEQTDLTTDAIEGTTADLRPDGSWEVTLSAPVDMPMGVTKSYSVHAQCVGFDQPYYAPPRNPDSSTTTIAPAFQYARYALRPLYVTGFGPSDVQEGEGPSGTTSTTGAMVTTSTTAGSSLLSAGSKSVSTTSVSTASAPSPTASASVTVEDASARWDQIRRELVAAKRGSATPIELASAAGTPEVTATPGAGGIPWWAFALATMLAVGMVVAFGARRTSALSELDRQSSGD
jgi:hypothetical protein